MLRRNRIDDVQNSFETGPFGGLDRLPPIGRRVRRVRSAQLVDAVGGEPFEPEIGYGRRRDLKRQHRAAADRTQRCFSQALLEQANALPRIFLEIAHAFFIKRGGHDLDGLEAGAIEPLSDRQHHSRAHIGRPQAQVAIAQGGVDEEDRTGVYLIAHVRASDGFAIWQGTHWGWREEVRLNRDANSNTSSLSVSLFAQFVENTAIEEIVFLDLGACCIGLAFLFEKYFDAVIVGV